MAGSTDYPLRMVAVEQGGTGKVYHAGRSNDVQFVAL